VDETEVLGPEWRVLGLEMNDEVLIEQPTDREPWERWPREPRKWFARFDKYFRSLGSERTVEEAYRRWKAKEAPDRKGARAPKSWGQMSRKWLWWERAEKWDEEEKRQRWLQEKRSREEALRAIEGILRTGHNIVNAVLKPEMDRVRQGQDPLLTGRDLRDTIKAMSDVIKGLRFHFGIRQPEPEAFEEIPEERQTGVLVVESGPKDVNEWAEQARKKIAESQSSSLHPEEDVEDEVESS
jgi:hypothetical protein